MPGISGTHVSMRRATSPISTLLITGIFAAVLSCTSPSTPPTAPPGTPTPALKQLSTSDIPKLEKQLHDRINKERTRRGLPTMRWDDARGRIAGKHSRDMATSKYSSHTSPEGHGYSYRYMKAGYACGVTVNGVLRRGAENIYRISPDGGGDIAEATVRGWMQDREDRKNILSEPWSREGIGICTGQDGVLYITLNFC